ncbi:FkbM family methyltransferase [Rhizobium sp. FKL33]|uniref:FkbM family methyltransferase n=1 Tax=Rhizobium sp. FKL33 TaxID=2562307 RepID=UPI0010BFC01F|nr:FkbM family methyltransferase [Rhizobium sp. FKL33]
MNQPLPTWTITLKDGVGVVANADVRRMTSYVLLEQEDWFEAEMDFIRALATSDMQALDIGANHGVYALTIANRLTSGHVWAFEPTSAPGGMLAKSIADSRLSDRLTLVAAGLSDRDGEADISISGNSETNSLHTRGPAAERIRLYALDEFWRRAGLVPDIDFVKLDAEGEEIAILKGGDDFFRSRSPLLMFELRHGSAVNHGLIEAVTGLGYDLYRLVPGLNALASYDPRHADGFLLNLFACKPDRAQRLAARGLLVDPEANTDAPRPDLPELLLRQHWAQPFLPTWIDRLSTLTPAYTQALGAALAASETAIPAATRYTLLMTAFQAISDITESGKGDLHHWTLRVRLADIFGARATALQIAGRLMELNDAAYRTIEYPVPPPSSRFDTRPFGDDFSGLKRMMLEYHELNLSFSSYFTAPSPRLVEILKTSGHDPEFDRRFGLIARRAGREASYAETHPLFASSSSPNAAIWRQICAAIHRAAS